MEACKGHESCRCGDFSAFFRWKSRDSSPQGDVEDCLKHFFPNRIEFRFSTYKQGLFRRSGGKNPYLRAFSGKSTEFFPRTCVKIRFFHTVINSLWKSRWKIHKASENHGDFVWEIIDLSTPPDDDIHFMSSPKIKAPPRISAFIQFLEVLRNLLSRRFLSGGQGQSPSFPHQDPLRSLSSSAMSL